MKKSKKHRLLKHYYKKKDVRKLFKVKKNLIRKYNKNDAVKEGNRIESFDLICVNIVSFCLAELSSIELLTSQFSEFRQLIEQAKQGLKPEKERLINLDRNHS